jgi:hypothetical protein
MNTTNIILSQVNSLIEAGKKVLETKHNNSSLGIICLSDSVDAKITRPWVTSVSSFIYRTFGENSIYEKDLLKQKKYNYITGEQAIEIQEILI